MDDISKKQFIGAIIGLIILIILGVAWASIGILCVINSLDNLPILTYWDAISAVWVIISISGLWWTKRLLK